MTIIQNIISNISNNPIVGLYHMEKERHQKIHKIMQAIKADPSLINQADQDQWTPLMHVITDFKAVQYLLEHGANVNAITKNGHNALSLAIKRQLSAGNPKIIQLLIDHGVNVNHVDHKGKTALMLVCQYQMYQNHVKLLVENGAELNKIDDYGKTALMYALKGNEVVLDTVKYLLDNGADASIKDHRGCSAWILTLAKPGHEPLLDVLINHTKDDCNFYAGLDPLTLALAKDEPIEKIKELIDNGHDMNKPEQNGDTTFMFACQAHTDANVIAMLIEHGADLTQRDKYDYTALHQACAFNSNTQVIQVLIDHGMSLNDTTDDGCNALHQACSHSEHPHIIEFLLPKMSQYLSTVQTDLLHPMEAALINNPNIPVIHTLHQHFQMDINTTDQNGKSFFMLASSFSREPKVLDYLIKHGANPWATTPNGANALHLACSDNLNLNTIEYLVELGFDVNQTDMNGKNAFHYAAAYNSNLDILKYLIAQKVDLYANDYDFNNAMHLACSFNQEFAVIEFLRTLNFDIHEPCADGNTALMYACDYGNSLAVVKYLVNAGVDLHAVNHRGASVMDCLDPENHRDVWNYIQNMSSKKSNKVLYA